MEVRFLWVQHEVRSGRISIKKIAGFDNPTDVATKHVDATTLMRCQSAAGLRRWSPSAGVLVALTLLPVVSGMREEGSEPDGSVFMIVMGLAAYGSMHVISQLIELVRGVAIAGSRTRTHVRHVGTQTELVRSPVGTQTEAARSYFASDQGKCFHSTPTCRGLHSRSTPLREFASRPRHLRACSVCHDQAGEPVEFSGATAQ